MGWLMLWATCRLDCPALAKRDLRPGDHIFALRGLLTIYSHHGIYIGDNKVIHFTGDQKSRRPSDCWQPGKNGVIISCLEFFLNGDSVRRYKYGVSEIHLCAKLGSCTVAPSDPPETVIRRAKHLLENGFGHYNLWTRNCEDFALYCKTGFVVTGNVPGASGQILKLRGMFQRWKGDIGIRDDKIKLPVEHIFSVAESTTNFCVKNS